MTTIRRRSFLQGSLALTAGAVSRSIWAEDENPMPVIGKVRPQPSVSIAGSPLGVGFECLDRQMFDPEPYYPLIVTDRSAVELA